MNNLVKIFENQEVKVKTDKGVMLYNLACTAKVCGLVRNDKGYQYVRWSDIKDKLKFIGKNCFDESPSKEIKYILEEIENTDDRNSIYMSSWLSKRLATECHSEKAMRYKNFLVTLDESREKVQEKSQLINLELVQNTVQAIVPTIATEIVKQFAPVISETKNQVNTISKLMYDQSAIYDQDREDLKSLIGLRAVNTKRLTDKLKEKLYEIYGFNVTGNNEVYIKVKKKVFKYFKVIKWEDIPVAKYSTVDAFIDGLEKSDIGIG